MLKVGVNVLELCKKNKTSIKQIARKQENKYYATIYSQSKANAPELCKRRDTNELK